MKLMIANQGLQLVLVKNMVSSSFESKGKFPKAFF